MAAIALIILADAIPASAAETKLTYRLLDSGVVYRIPSSWGVKYRSKDRGYESIEFLLPTPIYDNTGAANLYIQAWDSGTEPDWVVKWLDRKEFESRFAKYGTRWFFNELRFSREHVVYSYSITVTRSANILDLTRVYRGDEGTLLTRYSLPMIPSGSWYKRILAATLEVERLATIGKRRMPAFKVEERASGSGVKLSTSGLTSR